MVERQTTAGAARHQQRIDDLCAASIRALSGQAGLLDEDADPQHEHFVAARLAERHRFLLRIRRRDARHDDELARDVADRIGESDDRVAAGPRRIPQALVQRLPGGEDARRCDAGHQAIPGTRWS